MPAAHQPSGDALAALWRAASVSAAAETSAPPGPGLGRPSRTATNVPGALDHASGVEEEFEAGIVAGAHGEPASDDVVAEEALEEDEALDGDDYEPGVDEEEASAGAVAGSPTANRPASGRGGLRAVGFLRASWPSSSACSGRTAARSSRRPPWSWAS